MILTSFVENLFETGRVKVNAPAEIESADFEAAREVLVRTEQLRRQELPGDLPDFEIEPALKAAELLFRGAQFQVHREINIEFVEAAFAERISDDQTPATHYSVDLCFRYLPDLHRLASAASSDDPFLTAILQLAADWPLSAVGLPVTAGKVWHPALQHRALQRMFVDRIIARNDRARMADPRVHEKIRAVIGAHPELVPRLPPLTDGDENVAEEDRAES